MVPHSLLWRRWENGQIIGNARLNPQSEEWFGSPYYVTHRAHLHEILHQKAVELGAKINLGNRIDKYNVDVASFVLAGGEVIHADLIVAADGMRKSLRQNRC